MSIANTDAASDLTLRHAEASRRAGLDDVSRTLAAQLIGHEVLIERLMIALLSGGHVLLEGPPGLAKTRTVNRFAELLEARGSKRKPVPTEPDAALSISPSRRRRVPGSTLTRSPPRTTSPRSPRMCCPDASRSTTAPAPTDAP